MIWPTAEGRPYFFPKGIGGDGSRVNGKTNFAGFAVTPFFAWGLDSNSTDSFNNQR